MIHIALHFLVPAIVALVFYKDRIAKAFFIMIATMLIDMDHLLAIPIYDPIRCSIGYHPFHSYYIIPFYFILLFFPKFRLVGIGLVIHMILDFLDCFL